MLTRMKMRMRTKRRIPTSESMVSPYIGTSVPRRSMLTRSDSDDEDETAALMAELAKIKQERAEEKARQVSTASYRNAPCHVFPPLIAFIDLMGISTTCFDTV